MRPLLSPQEMAAADRRTIDAGTPDEVLMERAGRAVVRAVIELAGAGMDVGWPSCAARGTTAATALSPRAWRTERDSE